MVKDYHKGKLIRFFVNEEISLQFKEKCKEEGFTITEVLKSAVYSYLYGEYTPKKEYYSDNLDLPEKRNR